jgi:hypothetical protein
VNGCYFIGRFSSLFWLVVCYLYWFK